MMACAFVLGLSAVPPAREHLTYYTLLTDNLRHALVQHRSQLPAILSADDREEYAAIFADQSKQEWNKADHGLARLNDRSLVGHVLAERYLSPHYQASFAELAQWLRDNPDHPRAYAIYQLALSKRPNADAALAKIAKRPVLQGYGDDASHISRNAIALPDHASWLKGIAAWKKQDYLTAARHFETLAGQREQLTSWDEAGADFWAYRAYEKAGMPGKARPYLERAAQEPRSFYGIIARKALGWKLPLDLNAHRLQQQDLASLYDLPAIRRAIALTEAGQADLAELELRQLFPGAPSGQRQELLALAQLLDLPAIQIRMGRMLASEDKSYDFAVYPTPQWQPRAGYAVDPALIFAVARQESGFHSQAESHAGAFGLMQLMPQTASYIARRQQEKEHDVSLRQALAEPMENIRLGQSYIRDLLSQKHIQGNLFFLAAAYNAGPGKLMEWQHSLDFENDPLLFVESIPYSETRHYVRRLMTSYWIYREILDQESSSVTALLEDNWPLYTPPHGEFASVEVSSLRN